MRTVLTPFRHLTWGNSEDTPLSPRPHQPLVAMTHRHPLDQEHTITWTTNYKGTTYVLDHHGRLQPAQRIGAAMSTAHLDQMRENRQRDATRAVHAELLQLAIRRAEQHAKEQR